MKKHFIAGALVLSLSFFAFAPATYAAGLTSTQIQAILSLLTSFGASSATIANVSAALNGQTNTPAYPESTLSYNPVPQSVTSSAALSPFEIALQNNLQYLNTQNCYTSNSALSLCSQKVDDSVALARYAMDEGMQTADVNTLKQSAASAAAQFGLQAKNFNSATNPALVAYFQEGIQITTTAAVTEIQNEIYGLSTSLQHVGTILAQ
jgi:hypothetical protein